VPDAEGRLRVLFLCTGNSCRSQMAEGWAHALKSDRVEAYSAGTSPHGLNPMAVRAMAEAGVDISGHTSKRPEQIGVEFDVVVTVCDSAHEACPVFPGARVVHAGFEDPPRLAKNARSDEEAMAHYRRVRDEIRAFVLTLPGSIATAAGHPGAEFSCGCSGPCGPGAEDPFPPPPGPALASLPLAGAAPASADVREQVRAGYAQIARAGSWSAAQTLDRPGAAAGDCCAGGGCCGPATFTPEQLAAAIGYAGAELDAVPEGANMGLSCGNPTALAALRPGETVIDLGSGGGFDCFVAGAKVGPSGRVIGVDMTPDMIAKARRNTAGYTAQSGLSNVEFRLGEIENIPAADGSADVVISNCVLNLSPDKPRVWREIARVLKPGGRAAVSDLALLRSLPETVQADVEALVGCVAGAVLVEEIRRDMLDAGFTDVTLTPKPEYIRAMTDWQDPLYRRIVEALPAGSTPADFITSLDIAARKPA
jgi:thioredoxin type arsenate reductase